MQQVITRHASMRVCEFAFQYAKDNNKKSVAVLHKVC